MREIHVVVRQLPRALRVQVTVSIYLNGRVGGAQLAIERSWSLGVSHDLDESDMSAIAEAIRGVVERDWVAQALF